MTGNSFVNAQVSFRDLDTGEVWGDRNYDASSSTWQGVFSPMTDKQVHAICKEIVTTISGRANPNTSQMTANSNGATPWVINAATTCGDLTDRRARGVIRLSGTTPVWQKSCGHVHPCHW